jgi:hypothetical protein
MSRPDEGLIHTWLDGECTPEESARIEALVASDPAWAAAVAEARGLVAASSRILGALDAVPAQVLPAGSRAASVERARGFRVRPWMGIAAGLVLVAGTAVILREQPTAVFAPSAAVEDVPITAAPAVSTETDQTADAGDAVASRVPAAPSVPTEIPTIGPARTTGAGAPAVGVGRGVVAGTRADTASVMEPVTAERAAELSAAVSREMETGRAAEAVRTEAAARAQAQESRRVFAPPPPPTSLAARDPSGFAVAAKAIAPTVLAGCWRVSAPPELVGLLREPIVVRIAGDTLVLHLDASRQVTVVRAEDRLRGALEAVREPCTPDGTLSPRP